MSDTPVWVYNDHLTVEYVEQSAYVDAPSPCFEIHTPGASFCLRPDVEAAALVEFLRAHGALDKPDAPALSEDGGPDA